MKTLVITKQRLFIVAFTLLLILATIISANAQTPKKKMVRMKTVQNINGKVVEKDTTFEAKDDANGSDKGKKMVRMKTIQNINGKVIEKDTTFEAKDDMVGQGNGKKMVRIKTIENENGKITEKDTTFESKDDVVMVHSKSTGKHRKMKQLTCKVTSDAHSEARDKNAMIFEQMGDSEDFISRNENVLDSLMQGKKYSLDKDGNQVYEVKGDEGHDLILKKLKDKKKYVFNFNPPFKHWNGNEFNFHIDDKLLKLQLDSIQEHMSFISDSINVIVEKAMQRADSALKMINFNIKIDDFEKGFNDSLPCHFKFFNHCDTIGDNMNFNFNFDCAPMVFGDCGEGFAYSFENEGDKDVQVYQNGDTIITKRVIKHKKDGDKTPHRKHHKKVIVIAGDDANSEDVRVFSYNNSKGKKVVAKITIVDLKDADKKTLKSKGIDTNTESKNELNVEGINFAPNPNDGKFNLGFTLENEGNTSIKIFDISGKEVYSENLNNFKGLYSKDIDISNNGKGTYFLKITQGKKAISKKIMIQ